MTNATQVGAMLVAASIFGGIALILKPRGLYVQLSACSFVVSLVVTQLLMKRLSSPPMNYRFPLTVTAMHFFSVWMVCIAYWATKYDIVRFSPLSIGSYRRYFVTITPITLSLPASVALNNVAMTYVGASVNAVVGTLTPIVTAAVACVLGRGLSCYGCFGMLIACIGALVVTYGELQYAAGDAGLFGQSPTLLGLSLSGASVIARSLKVVMQDRLLNASEYGAKGGDDSPGPVPMGPMHLWALQSTPCLFVAICYSLAVERWSEAWALLTWQVGGLILCTCASATWLNLAGMCIIKDLGASSMQIVGKMNTIVTIALSVALLGEHLPIAVVIGTVVVLFGVSIFEHAETSSRSQLTRKEARGMEV
eukprot:TRINITY_DN57417_c0_g1_i1.p1 TRINITY_DN57417_c0_g1~~TRINITY_DN57417_c0_g1_i1.p1  ORF type:complete len:366 (+),score=48.64 TRINITY_DN57417_c0_g1_i1:131-1228(+)